jgi:alkanesulfonate monooxygenase SsuD/methylene tetrahydromethanopterin reductase-like flavin-dependent oxidoreductase (luciferase family)
MASQMLRVSVVGSPATVRTGLDKLIEETGADELMVVTGIFDQAAKLRSLELLAAC